MNRSKGRGRWAVWVALAALMMTVSSPVYAETKTLETKNTGQGTLNCFWSIDGTKLGEFEVGAGATHTTTTELTGDASVCCRPSGIVSRTNTWGGYFLCEWIPYWSPYTCCDDWCYQCGPPCWHGNRNCSQTFYGKGDGKCEKPDLQ